VNRFGGTNPSLSAILLISIPIIAESAAPGSTLRVNRVRLEPSPPPAEKPSVVLKFDLVNHGLLAVRITYLTASHQSS
jgi:hypothetical protein